jgi:hypothetical protein
MKLILDGKMGQRSGSIPLKRRKGFGVEVIRQRAGTTDIGEL